MKSISLTRIPPPHGPSVFECAAGFSLVEFLLASLITLVIAGAAFELLAGAQRSLVWQADMQDVLDSVRSAMDTTSRHVRQAANDPLRAGFEGITIAGTTEVRLRSDITGSGGAADPDKGDADGDTEDAAEDVTLRYDAANRSIDIASGASSSQAIAGNISAFGLQYFDAQGNETAAGGSVRGIKISITGEGVNRDSLSGRPLRIQIVSYVSVATRR